MQTRDQKTMRVINAVTGAVIREDTDPIWTDVIEGVPAQLPGGDIVWTGISGDTRGLIIAPAAELATATPVTPAGLQVQAVVGTDGRDVLFAGSAESTELGIWRYGPDGLTAVAPSLASTPPRPRRDDRADQPDAGQQRGHGAGRAGRRGHRGHRLVRAGAEPAAPGAAVHRGGAGRHPDRRALPLVVFAGDQAAGAHVPLRRTRAQEVVKSARVYLTPQWFAEQGFAVVVADGRGTPGRGPAWDRTISGDFADGILEDQVTALGAAAEKFTDLDTTKVGIRGWSFGGYLAALAVLRRPDVFHAGVAGAPPPTGGSTTPTTPSAT